MEELTEIDNFSTSPFHNSVALAAAHQCGYAKAYTEYETSLIFYAPLSAHCRIDRASELAIVVRFTNTTALHGL